MIDWLIDLLIYLFIYLFIYFIFICMLWSSVMFIKLSISGSWSSIVYHVVDTTFILLILEFDYPHRECFDLKLFISVYWEYLSYAQYPIDGHVWVCLLTLFRPSTDWSSCFGVNSLRLSVLTVVMCYAIRNKDIDIHTDIAKKYSVCSQAC